MGWRRLLKRHLHCHLRRRSQINQPHDPRSRLCPNQNQIRQGLGKIIWQQLQTLLFIQTLDLLFDPIGHQIKLRKRYENLRTLKQYQNQHCRRIISRQTCWRNRSSRLVKIIKPLGLWKIKTFWQKSQTQKFDRSHHRTLRKIEIFFRKQQSSIRKSLIRIS